MECHECAIICSATTKLSPNFTNATQSAMQEAKTLTRSPHSRPQKNKKKSALWNQISNAYASICNSDNILTIPVRLYPKKVLVSKQIIIKSFRESCRNGCKEKSARKGPDFIKRISVHEQALEVVDVVNSLTIEVQDRDRLPADATRPLIFLTPFLISRLSGPRLLGVRVLTTPILPLPLPLFLPEADLLDDDLPS